jgi:hypothetical protein
MMPGASANPAVYLVELRATHASSLEIRGMHLAVATARRRRRPGPVAERKDHPRAVPKPVLHCRRPSRRRRAQTTRPPQQATGTRRGSVTQRGRRPLTATASRTQRTSNSHNRAIRWPAKATGRT